MKGSRWWPQSATPMTSWPRSRHAHTAAPDAFRLRNGLTKTLWSESGAVASVSAPIFVVGEAVGSIGAGVTNDPERLAITPRLADRLKGLAAGLHRLRQRPPGRPDPLQAAHGPVTGLPNRPSSWIAPSRCWPGLGVPVAALFIDLHGFKGRERHPGPRHGGPAPSGGHRELSVTTQGVRLHRPAGRRRVPGPGGRHHQGRRAPAGGRAAARGAPGPLRAGGGDGCPRTLTVSLGIAAGTRPTAAELLRDADIALYQAKAAGKDCSVAFEPEMHTAVQDRHLLEMVQMGDQKPSASNQQRSALLSAGYRSLPRLSLIRTPTPSNSARMVFGARPIRWATLAVESPERYSSMARATPLSLRAFEADGYPSLFGRLPMRGHDGGVGRQARYSPRHGLYLPQGGPCDGPWEGMGTACGRVSALLRDLRRSNLKSQLGFTP
jgi:hypothetical protein